MAKLKNVITFIITLFFSLTINCQKSPKLNIIETNPSSSITPFQKDWANKNISQKWIEIKKTKGYLIYQPCDGNTFLIDWKTQVGILEIRYQIEPQYIKYDIREDINSDNKFFIDFSKDKSKVAQIEAKAYDLKNQIVLFEIDNQFHLMTPFENKDSFRKIENKREKGKVSELEFLQIN